MAKRKNIKICVILPAFNEAAVIRKVLRSIPRSVLIGGRRVQLRPVVINDGSTDATAAVVRKINGVTLIEHPVNMGAGAATRTGLHYARQADFDMAATMDADGQHAATDLIDLITTMIEQPATDLLIGGRLADAADMPLHKRIGNRLLSYSTFVIFGAYVSDSQSGFRVFSRQALEKLEFHSNGYVFCSEMLWQAKRAGLHLAEHPVQAIYTDYSLRKGQKSYSGGLKILQQLISRRLMELLS